MGIQPILKQLEGAFAENTLRAYRADLNAFDYWCKSQQLTPEPF
jgi:site-specific recombinase XerD